MVGLPIPKERLTSLLLVFTQLSLFIEDVLGT